MPAVFLAIPVAAALAWWLLKGGPTRRRPRSGGPLGDVDGVLEPGATGKLAPGEAPFKREELPFATGGEYGGMYGPPAGEGGAGVGAQAPEATETSLTYGGVPLEGLFAPPAPGSTLGDAFSGGMIEVNNLITTVGGSAGLAEALQNPILAPAPAPAPVSTSGGCFVAGTAVAVPGGGTRPIESLEVGDEVLAYDVASGELVPAKVEDVDRHEADDERGVVEVRTAAGTLVGTPEHVVWTGERWKALGEAEALVNGAATPVLERRALPGAAAVYNLHVVHPDHTYLAGGFIVHNAKAIPI